MQHITCCCETLDRLRYNVFGKPSVEPEDISTTCQGPLSLYKRQRVTESVLNESLGLHNKPLAEVFPELKLTGPK